MRRQCAGEVGVFVGVFVEAMCESKAIPPLKAHILPDESLEIMDHHIFDGLSVAD